jgi:hypothetical protein
MSEELRQAAIAILRDCQQPGDTEAAHSRADDAICDLLRSLGYGDVVDEWEKVDKWYA